MSILTDLLAKKITFNQAATEAGAWAQKVVAADPTMTAAAGAVLSDVKQAASNAIDMADTWVGQHIGPMTTSIETAADAALAAATGGKSISFNGFVNDGIDRMVAAGKAELDAWALKAKASMIPPGP